MNDSYSNLGNSHIIIGGEFVSAQVSRVVEAIHDYSPELRVEWVPERARKEGQSAFAIVHVPVGGKQPPYVLFYVKDEAEFDERVLLKVIYGDQRNGKVQLSELEAWEESQRLLAKQDYLDRMEEAKDIAAHVFASPLHSYRVSKELLIKDGIPFNAERLNRKRGAPDEV